MNQTEHTDPGRKFSSKSGETGAKLPKPRMELAEFRVLLKELGWNQVTAAKELHVSANYICMILKERRKPSPMLEDLLKSKINLHASNEFRELKKSEVFREILLTLNKLDGEDKRKALAGIASLIKALVPT